MSSIGNKKKLAVINSTLAIASEVVSVISGFILPRLILMQYGSAYNGLISSISQFLSCIILLNGGVGGVTRAALYKALAKNNSNQISSIVNATQKYLRKICFIFLFILFFIAIVLPFRFVEDFPVWSFVFSLTLILGINYFARYFVSLAYQMLLIADQKQYIRSLVSIVTITVSTIISAVLIVSTCDIRIVKLVGALVFVFGAIFVKRFTIKKYKIDSKVAPDNSAIKQRWDAFAHTVANYVHANTDLVILTVFTNALELSVYAVHYLAINGIKHLFDPINTAIEGFLGNVYMQEKKSVFLDNFHFVEMLVFSTTFVCFSCCSIALPYFTNLYTKAVKDVDYVRPLFASIACLAEMLYCMRIPYQSVVQSTGHFKETRNGAILEAVINIVVSLVLVYRFGMIGVAFGTLIAMCIRTVQYAYFTICKILEEHIVKFWIRILVYIFVFVALNFSAFSLRDYIQIDNWFVWVCFCVGIVIVLAFITLLIELILNKNNIIRFFRFVRIKILNK